MLPLLFAAQATGVDAALSNGWTPAAVATLLLLATLALGKMHLAHLQRSIAYREEQIEKQAEKSGNTEAALLSLLSHYAETLGSLALHSEGQKAEMVRLREAVERLLARPM